MTFKERFLRARKIGGFTQRGLAEKLDVTFQSIQKWESGETTPRGKRIEKIAALLYIRAGWLFTGERNNYDIRFGDNIRKIRQGKGLSKTDMVELLNLPSHRFSISPGRYACLEKGEAVAQGFEMQYLAAVFEIDDWQDLQLDPFSEAEAAHAVKVMSAEDAIGKLIELVPGKTLINIYENIEASAGDGSVNGYEEPTDHIWVENKWLQEIVHFVPEKMAIIKVRGDSMEPTLSPGDMILIDRQPIERNQLNDGVYVINRNETTHVKRLQCVEGGIRIISDNKALYDSETVTDGFTICGRVIWAWRGKRF